VRRLTAALASAAALGLVALAGCSSGPAYFLDDEFAGPAGSAPGLTWSYDLGSGTWGAGQQEAYTRSRANSYLDGDGHLVIALTRDGASYRSARLVSKAAFTEGDVIEARIRLDVARGAWPAWWLLGPSDTTELDMLENYGRNASVQATAWNGAARPVITAGKSGSAAAGSGWHTYQLAWTAAGLTFSQDGRPYLVVSAQQAEAWGYDAGKPMHMILNIAAGGIAGTPPATQRFPVTMEVDWVRAWKDS
jgi:beta-glucanase (GH16 family)